LVENLHYLLLENWKFVPASFLIHNAAAYVYRSPTASFV